MAHDLSSRLRSLRDRRGWTVADMAERTGIPKRTLDKYMLRSGASLPGFEALISLSKGLGVSLDWLVFGPEHVRAGSNLLAAMAASQIGLSYIETLLKYDLTGERPVFEDGSIIGLSPEEWTASLAFQIGERAQELAAGGITYEELLDWQARYKERQIELLDDRLSRRRDAVVTPPPPSPKA